MTIKPVREKIEGMEKCVLATATTLPIVTLSPIFLSFPLLLTVQEILLNPLTRRNRLKSSSGETLGTNAMGGIHAIQTNVVS